LDKTTFCFDETLTDINNLRHLLKMREKGHTMRNLNREPSVTVRKSKDVTIDDEEDLPLTAPTNTTPTSTKKGSKPDPKKEEKKDDKKKKKKSKKIKKK